MKTHFAPVIPVARKDLCRRALAALVLLIAVALALAATAAGTSQHACFSDLARAEALGPERPNDQVVLAETIRRFSLTLTASEALGLLDAGLLTSTEYVDALIRHIESHPEINAFIHLEADGARAAAAVADRKRSEGEPLGPLHGLPVILKDSINSKGIPTTAGTPALGGFVPAENAPVVQSLIDAGAIILGKTNLHELSAGFTTNNFFTGATRNPYDLDRIPGGSSGGNGAALAARFAPLAIGEDTGGSVRVPAALTGTMGFRPTAGRYSQDGVVPISGTLDTLGPMARSVRDLALADAVITGDPRDLESMPVGDIRLGVPTAFFRENLDTSVDRAFSRVLRRLEAAGVTLVPADIPGAGDMSLTAFQAITFFEAPVELATYLAEHATGVTVGELVGMIASPDVAELFALAASGVVSEAQYLEVVEALVPLLRSWYRDYLDANALDAVIYPTTMLPAAFIGEDQTVLVNGQPVPTFQAYLRQTHYAPVIGAPAVTLPMGHAETGLPVGGIDIAARLGDDRRVLALADAIAPHMPPVRAPEIIQPPFGRGCN